MVDIVGRLYLRDFFFPSQDYCQGYCEGIECAQDLVDSLNLQEPPKPSTDFSEVLSNPNKRYLVYSEEHKSWFIGYCRYGDDYVTVDSFEHSGKGPTELTHWLPLPPDP